MNTDTNLQVTKSDVALVRKTLYLLTAPQKTFTLIITILAVIVWWLACKFIIGFGSKVDYSSLQALGDNTYNMVKQYNFIIWWALSGIITIILIYAIYGFVATTQRSVQQKNIPLNTARSLGQKLSHSGRQVLIWSWKNQDEPINIGVLQNTLSQMKSNRAEKINLLRQHKSIFELD